MSFLSDLNAIDHAIDLNDAVDLVNNLDTVKETMLDTSYQSKNCMLRYETFNKSTIASLLGQEGMEGLRIYVGIDSNDKLRLILCGVNADGVDAIKADIESISQTGVPQQIDEAGQRWP